MLYEIHFLANCCFKILSSIFVYLNALKFASKGLLFNLLCAYWGNLSALRSFWKAHQDSSGVCLRQPAWQQLWWKCKMSWMGVSISGGRGCEGCEELGQQYWSPVFQGFFANMALALQDLSCCLLPTLRTLLVTLRHFNSTWQEIEKPKGSPRSMSVSVQPFSQLLLCFMKENMTATW